MGSGSRSTSLAFPGLPLLLAGPLLGMEPSGRGLCLLGLRLAGVGTWVR